MSTSARITEEELEREIKITKETIFFLHGKHENFIEAVNKRKMLAATKA